MNSNFQPASPTRRLIDAMLDGVSSAEQFGELSALLAADAALRSWYCEYVALHGLISAEMKAAAPRPATARPPSTLGFLGDVIGRAPGGEFVVGGLILLAVSGALWGVIHLARTLGRGDKAPQVARGLGPADIRGIGLLSADDAARWAPGSRPTEDSVRVGQRYELEAGWAKIELARGTRVAIEGPATWQLFSDQRMELDVGKLVAEVPAVCIGFTVVTPTAEVVDLGTEFGVEVDQAGATDLHVLRGRVELKSNPAGHGSAARRQEVVAGQALRLTASGQAAAPIPLDAQRFEAARALATHSPTLGLPGSQSWRPGQPIWLGNLFDDRSSRQASLVDAIHSDSFRAQASSNSLAVARVEYGGGAIKEIAPGIQFDAMNLGWQSMAYAEAPVTNDAWYAGGGHADSRGQLGGIRTQGETMSHNEPRIEEGIGEHANALITFDLDEIRTAGGLAGHGLEFRCDRAGLNDATIGYAPDRPSSTVHMVVVVASAAGVRQVLVDGRSLPTTEHDRIWSVAQAVGEPLKADGRFVEFRVALPVDVRWLTLLVSSAGDEHFADAAVWSGARLEVNP